MKRLNRKTMKIVAAILVLVMMATVVSLAVFTDRESAKMQFTTATFSTDGYTLKREAPVGPFIAGEDVSVTLWETNTKDEDVNSVITMNVDWNSPDVNSKIFGNSNAADNAIIKLSGHGIDGSVKIDYTVNKDGTITFDLPKHLLAQDSSDCERQLTFTIPDSLAATGTLDFTFQKVDLSQVPSGFTAEYSAADLNAETKLNFDVDVGWAASANTANNGKNLMAYLTSDGNGIEFEHAFGSTTSAMKDFSSASDALWSNYNDTISKITFIEGMTTIGDYAFADFTNVTSVSFPSTITGIGISSFDGSGLAGEVTIPKNVTTIEERAFGNLPKVTVFTFGHDENDVLTLPNNEASGKNSAGAFHVGSPYSQTAPLGTKVNSNNKYVLDYDWSIDARGYTVTVKIVTGLTVTAAPTTAINGQSIELTSESAAGYEYNGAAVSWVENSSPKSLNLSKDELSFIMPVGNVTVIPAASLITYNIKYETNGGSLADDVPTEFTVVTDSFDLPTPTQTGYHFDGWYEESDFSGDEVTELPKGSIGDKTFYAKWVPITYQVKYNANSGIGTMSNSTHTYDTAKALTKNAFTKSGYEFASWNTKADGSGTGYADQASVKNLTSTDGAVIDLYAQWKLLAYDITYHTNGGTLPDDADTDYTVEDPATLPEPTRPGYEFNGWYENEDFSGNPVTDTEGETGDKDYYAKWTPITYSVKYNANGGSGTMANSNHTYDVAKNLTKNTFTKTGYTFAGWAISADGAVKYTDEQSVKNLSATDGATVNLYAKWNIVVYDITYHPNGGTLPDNADTDYTVEDPATLPDPTKPGYEFNGWYENEDFSGNPVTDTEGETGDKDYYAKWTPITYQVKYNANGGSGSMANSSHTYDTSKNLTKNTFTKTGYTFAGWATSADGAVKYTDEQSVKNLTATDGATVNLYAKWTANAYTVKYNANGGSGSMANSSHTYDTAKNLTKNTFTKTGYTFAGWATSADGAVKYTDEQSVKNLSATDGATVNLYAKWTANTYTVKYNANGGSGSMASSTHTYDTAKNLTNNSFTKEGYIFLGWATSADGEVVYTDAQSVKNLASTNGATVNLYAKWEYAPEPILAKWNVLGIMGYSDFNGVEWNEYNQPVDAGQTDFHQYKRSVTEIEIMTSYALPAGFDTSVGYGPWDVSENQDQSVMAYVVDLGYTITNYDDEEVPAYKVYICNNQEVTKKEQKVIANPTSSYIFNNFNFLLDFKGGANLDMSRATSVDRMFWDCYYLETLDVSTWNMGKVASAWEMFCYAGDGFDLDVSNWDVSSLKNAQGMFRYCGATALDVSNWNTKSLENASELFCGVWNLTELDVSNWNTSNVTNLEATFNGLNVTTLDVARKTVNAGTTNEYIAWDTSKVTNTSSTFAYCRSLETLDVSNWKMSLVEDASTMFSSCELLEVIDVSQWNTSSLVDAFGMFQSCKVVTQLDVSGWDTSKVDDFRYMFQNCASLNALDVSSFTFESIQAPTKWTNFLNGFAIYCNSLTQITFGDGWSSVTLPDAGDSDSLFYLRDPYTETSPLGTTVITDCSNILDYDWAADHRGFIITVASVTGGTVTVDQNVAVNGETISLTAAASSGYTYKGASLSYEESGSAKTVALDAETTSFTMPAADLTITPKWEASDIYVTLKYMDNVTPDETIKYTGTIPTPTRTGYNFDGWHVGYTVKSLDKFTNPNSSYAWTQDSNGVWSSGNAGVNSSTSNMLSEEFTIPADGGTISFDWRSNGESYYDFLGYDIYNVSTGTYLSGSSSPTYKSCLATLKGSASTSFTTVTKNLDAGTYQLLFMYGKDSSTDKNEDRGFVKNISVPGEGNTWLYGNKFDGNATNGMVLMAKWNPIEYTIAYDLDGGSESTNPTTYTIETPTFTLNAPTKSGYDFVGWTGSNGNSASKTVTIAQGSSGNLSYKANWEAPEIAQAIFSAEDGSLTFIKDTKLYTTSDTYNDKTITAVYTGFEDTSYTGYKNTPWANNREKIYSVVFEDEITPISTDFWFNRFLNCSNIDVTKLNTSSVTSMEGMFDCAGYNATTFTLTGLENWDVSSVTNMHGIFSYAGYNAATFTLTGLENWDTSSITDMAGMFNSAGFKATTWRISNLSNWDTSSATDMSTLFGSAGYSATTFTLTGLENWDTSSVTDMSKLFMNIGYKATTWSISNLSNWDTSSVTTMSDMFYCAGRSATNFTLYGLGNWNTSSVNNMTQMFYQTGYSATYTLDLTNWNVNNVTAYTNFNYGVTTKVLAPTFGTATASLSSALDDELPIDVTADEDDVAEEPVIEDNESVTESGETETEETSVNSIEKNNLDESTESEPVIDELTSEEDSYPDVTE